MVDREILRGNVKYVQTGKQVDIEIYGNKDETPTITAVVPAPSLNCKDESERQKRFDDAIENLILEGQFITSMKRIKNQAFDLDGEKTTLQIVYRPCKNEDEIKAIYDKIRAIMDKRIKKLDKEK